jgi:hypothetical protein
VAACTGGGVATDTGCVGGLGASLGTTVARTDENGLGAAVAGCVFCAHAIGKAQMDKQKAVRATSGFKRCLCFTAALIKYIRCVWGSIVNGGQPRRCAKGVAFANIFTLGGFAAGIFGFCGVVCCWSGLRRGHGQVAVGTRRRCIAHFIGH